MRENKWIIVIGLPITAVVLLFAWSANIYGCDFLCNVLLGVFGSGLLTVMVGGINYLTMRRRTLEAFWSYGHKAISNLNRYSADDDLDTAIDVFLQMAEFDYQPFDDAFGEMCFLFHNKKLHKEIAERIYTPIMEVRNLVQEKSFHFKLYKRAENGNRAVMQRFVDEIDKLLIERKSHDVLRDDGEVLTITETAPYKVFNLRTEFNNYYYWIMYPLAKKENKDNDH